MLVTPTAPPQAAGFTVTPLDPVLQMVATRAPDPAPDTPPFAVLGDAQLLRAQGVPITEITAPSDAGSTFARALPVLNHPAPVPVDSRLRSHVRFGEVRDLPAGKQLIVEHTVEIDGQDKPACVAQHVVLLLG